MRRLEAAEGRRREQIEERLAFEARTREKRIEAEDQLRVAKERLHHAEQAQHGILDQINLQREDAQSAVKDAGDMMARALASQRQASDEAIEQRKAVQRELEESQRQLEAIEREARQVFEEIRRAESADVGDGEAEDEVEIPDSM